MSTNDDFAARMRAKRGEMSQRLIMRQVRQGDSVWLEVKCPRCAAWSNAIDAIGGTCAACGHTAMEFLIGSI